MWHILKFPVKRKFVLRLLLQQCPQQKESSVLTVMSAYSGPRGVCFSVDIFTP